MKTILKRILRLAIIVGLSARFCGCALKGDQEIFVVKEKRIYLGGELVTYEIWGIYSSPLNGVRTGELARIITIIDDKNKYDIGDTLRLVR